MALGQVVIEEVDDPALAERMRVQDRKLRRNLAVFDAHAQDLFSNQRGKVIVVAGEELHITDTAEEAWAWAESTHPDDEGVFVHYIPVERGWRIYGNVR